jgi:hypothetical protein
MYLQKVIIKNFCLNYIFVGILGRSMTKIGGSGSISQRHGSPDPDPPQYVMDPQHCFLKKKLSYNFHGKLSYVDWNTDAGLAAGL